MLAGLKFHIYRHLQNSIRRFHGCRSLSGDSKSSKIWLDRQNRDNYTLRAKAESYRSRAAYKLMEIDKKHRIFKSKQTVVDLGFAPGSWSQVAAELVKPGGRVIGLDLLLVEPPEGVSAIQGNFLDPGVQLELETVLANPNRGRHITPDERSGFNEDSNFPKKRESSKADVVLSDMCGIWPQESGFWTNSINNSYRMANTSGVVARDHFTSMVSTLLYSNIRCLNDQRLTIPGSM